jgi:hypothetical protein
LVCRAFDIRREEAPIFHTMHMIPLIVVTAFFVLAIGGTVGKLLYDDWRVRRSMRPPLPLVLPPKKPVIPAVK